LRDEKKCHAWRLFDVILFSTSQKNQHEVSQCTNSLSLIIFMKSTTGVVQLTKSHVDKWGSEFSAGDQVLHDYYYEYIGNDFFHQRLVKNVKATVPTKNNGQ